MLYLSDNQIIHLKDQKLTTIPCQAIEQYKKNLEEIKQRKEWKSKGTGAQFMGLTHLPDMQPPSQIFPSDAVVIHADQIIYAARLDEGTAIYSKSLSNLQELEGLVLRKNEFVVYDMAYDSGSKRLVLSASAPYQYERHLSILDVDGNRIQYITEGDCQDANPVFDPQDPERIYYDSCGFAYDQQGRVTIGPKRICLLNLRAGELDTVLEDGHYNFLKPQKDAMGNLYFLKRPYKHKTDSLAPVRIIKAIIGWLDFFTQRYSGQPLKTTSGANPAKAKQKTQEELFIEGNLINAQKNRQQNINTGEKYPGIIPRSWELVKLTPSGELVTVKKGVLSYALKEGNVLYSNGGYLLKIAPDGTESMLAEGHLISKLVV